MIRASVSLLALSLCLSAVMGASCDSFVAPIGEGAPCVSDNECASPDYVCVIGVCVNPDNTALDQVHLEVRPLDESAYEPQQLLDVAVTKESGRTPIALRPTVGVYGTVVDGAHGGAVPAEVIAVQSGGIPGRALVVTASTNMASGAFTLPLVERDDYTLSLQPGDPTRPPVLLGSYSVGASPTGERPLQEGQPVTLPGLEELLRVSGRVTAGEGTAQLGVEALEVRLLDGNRRVSSQARTDALGAFELFLPREIASAPLELEVRPTQANRLNPTLRVPLELLEPLEDHVELGDVKLGALQAPVPFAGVVHGPDGRPVPNASIHVVGALGAGSFSLLITADEEGRYDAELRPARYDFVVVAPPSYSQAGLLSRYNAEVSAAAPPPVLNLPARLLLSGSVEDDDKRPVGNATVQMTRVGAAHGAAEPLLEGLTWTFTAVTDAEGRWQQRVDPGRYRVVVIPDASTTRPRHTQLIDVDAENDTHALRLCPSSVVAGVVQGAAGETLGMATLTAYAPLVGETGAAIELGGAHSAADGSFEILLPDLERCNFNFAAALGAQRLGL